MTLNRKLRRQSSHISSSPASVHYRIKIVPRDNAEILAEPQVLVIKMTGISAYLGMSTETGDCVWF